MRLTLAVLMLVVCMVPAARRSLAVPGPGGYCMIDAAAGTRAGSEGVLVNGVCRSIGDISNSGNKLQYRMVACSADRRAFLGHEFVGSCGSNVPACKLLLEGGQPGQPFIYAFQYQSRMPGGAWQAESFWCPHSQAPVAVPDAATIRDRVIRLLPRVEIGTAGPTATSLVNIQTLFWARTDESRGLGRVSVVGQPVWLRIAFDHADWDFGDGQHDTARHPGRPYDDAADPCAQVMCPDYYGHVYRSKGPMTITLRVSWNATFSLDGRNFAPVEGGVVTGPDVSTHLTVREARGVLVANPGD